ncbi:MAG TPA: HNH endonuclease [Chthonomonadaceae bacterium]|nr:HNH endonuclease [Chthonomonadaceae bacterium]
MAAFVRDNWTCSDCGRSHCYLEVQHIIGCAEGGSHELENLETLCVTCHDRRHHRKPRQVDTNGRPITKRKQKEAPT